MKLKITRKQGKKLGILGGDKGIEFILKCKIELTDKEKDIVKEANIGGYLLTTYYNERV